MRRAAGNVCVALVLLAGVGRGEGRYTLPPREVVEIVDAPALPVMVLSPARNAMVLVDNTSHPPLALLARPIHRLAGIRIDHRFRARQRLVQYTGMTLELLPSLRQRKLRLPADGRLGMPVFSPDGSRFACLHDRDGGAEVWVGDVATGHVRALRNVRVTDVLMAALTWTGDSRTLLLALVPPRSGRPPRAPEVPGGPNVEESSGTVSQVATYQDLLRTPYDEELFSYLGTTQLALVETVSGAITPVGKPDLYSGAEFSPDGRYLLVTRLRRPFSRRVPASLFAHRTEVWSRSGETVATVCDLPVADGIPRQGVPTGPRDIGWQALRPATLLWTEALDGGDPLRKVPARDRIVRWQAPFTGSGHEVMLVEHRVQEVLWTSTRDRMLLAEYNRDRRWRTVSVVGIAGTPVSRSVLFDLSVRDAYHDPGRPVLETRPDGETVLAQDGDWAYYSSRGASGSGERPALVKWNLTTGEHATLFESRAGAYEQFAGFVGEGRSQMILRCESPADPPNYVLADIDGTRRAPCTAFADPAPQLAGVTKELLRYRRGDGVGLSGTLYLPPGYRRGNRIPLLLWAYPLEYSDAGTAGQVRASPTRFTLYRGASPLFFLLRGYAVLMDATMPVVGEPETMNNTFVEQIVGSAKAAIDVLDSLGIIDRAKVLVSGHSYGAFMTANLLAHSNLFAAGIARSGAYNRTLTPFGFQSERRSFWEAPDVYMAVSPFRYADRITKPLLLIHGEADNNSGTFPIQSERLYEAIRGHGGTARLVMLPLEGHGYIARESVLHVLAEMLSWGDRFVKTKSVVPFPGADGGGSGR